MQGMLEIFPRHFRLSERTDLRLSKGTSVWLYSWGWPWISVVLGLLVCSALPGLHAAGVGCPVYAREVVYQVSKHLPFKYDSRPAFGAQAFYSQSSCLRIAGAAITEVNHHSQLPVRICFNTSKHVLWPKQWFVSHFPPDHATGIARIAVWQRLSHALKYADSSVACCWRVFICCVISDFQSATEIDRNSGLCPESSTCIASLFPHWAFPSMSGDEGSRVQALNCEAYSGYVPSGAWATLWMSYGKHGGEERPKNFQGRDKFKTTGRKGAAKSILRSMNNLLLLSEQGCAEPVSQMPTHLLKEEARIW